MCRIFYIHLDSISHTFFCYVCCQVYPEHMCYFRGGIVWRSWLAFKQHCEQGKFQILCELLAFIKSWSQGNTLIMVSFSCHFFHNRDTDIWYMLCRLDVCYPKMIEECVLWNNFNGWRAGTIPYAFFTSW